MADEENMTPKELGEEAAFPYSDSLYQYEGLNLKQHFASLNMAQMCGGEAWPRPDDMKEMAKRAVMAADALLVELAKD